MGEKNALKQKNPLQVNFLQGNQASQQEAYSPLLARRNGVCKAYLECEIVGR